MKVTCLGETLHFYSHLTCLEVFKNVFWAQKMKYVVVDAMKAQGRFCCYFILFRAEHAGKSLRWHWRYLWSVNMYHCHVNVVRCLWWSSSWDYIVLAPRLCWIHTSLRDTKTECTDYKTISKNQCGETLGYISTCTLHAEEVKHVRLHSLCRKGCG